MNFLPIGIYMATKIWMYITWFQYIQAYVSPQTTVFFMTASLGLWYNFIKVTLVMVLLLLLVMLMLMTLLLVVMVVVVLLHPSILGQ